MVLLFYSKLQFLIAVKKLKHIYDSGEIVLNKIVMEKIIIYLNPNKIKKLIG